MPEVRQIFSMAIDYINIFQSKGPPKFTQIGIFGMKMNHLATPSVALSSSKCFSPSPAAAQVSHAHTNDLLRSESKLMKKFRGNQEEGEAKRLSRNVFQFC
jgi:hypothetical protein